MEDELRKQILKRFNNRLKETITDLELGGEKPELQGFLYLVNKKTPLNK